MDTEVKNKIERRLRRRMLAILNSARPSEVRARMILDILEPEADFADLVAGDLRDAPTIVMQLMGDLCACTFASEHDNRKLKNDKRSIDNTSYGITADGTALLAGAGPKNGLVEDDRL